MNNKNYNKRQKQRGRKSIMEEKMHNEYNKVLQEMTKYLGSDTTFSDDLQRVAINILSNKFKGVYPSDKIPKLNELQPYSILNLDNSKMPGSHWIAVAYSPNDKSVSVYDSFGRKSSKIIPSLYKAFGGRIIDSDYDKEQRNSEDNCGQRCISWLKIFDTYGKQNALLI
jgi:hypothetical protein